MPYCTTVTVPQLPIGAIKHVDAVQHVVGRMAASTRTPKKTRKKIKKGGEMVVCQATSRESPAAPSPLQNQL